MARYYQNTYQVSQVKPVELKKLRGRRVYWLVENRSTQTIYQVYDKTPNTVSPSTDVGNAIAAGIQYELYNHAPNNELISIVGSNGATEQQVNVTEGYED